MVKTGMTERAKEVFDQALKVAEGIKDEKEWARALIAIAEEMRKAGLLDQALKVAEGIKDAWQRARALIAIAEGMRKAGLLDQALKVAEEIEGEEERARVLREIAEEMAKAEIQDEALWRDALKVAEGIKDEEERARALKWIAVEMAKVGKVEGAVGIVEREMAVRTRGLPSVLKALALRARKGDEKSKKDGFLKLLPLCGWSLKFAYKACGLLAWLYPERGGEIARVVSGE
jgi:lipopolysaccharide biosynthesis regulator YciM